MSDNHDKTPSPLEGVSITRFQGSTYIQETLSTIGLTRINLLSNNPNRVFWVAINESDSDVRLSTDPNISATSGWLLAAAGGVISMFWEQDGEGVGYAVYAIAAAVGKIIRVREVIRT